MINFREVNDYDVLKEWINFREEDLLSYTSEQDKAHNISALSNSVLIGRLSPLFFLTELSEFNITTE